MLIAALLPLTLASLMTGAASVDIFSAGSDPWALLVLMESRLPRTLAILLTGAALSVAGLLLQALVRNRFVGPDTVGTAESAALGLLVITLMAPAAPIWVKMGVACIFAMLGTAVFIAVIRRLPPQEIMLVPIAGIVVAGVIGSVVTYIALQADMVQYVTSWLMIGEFSGVVAGRYEILWLAGIAAALAWFAADRFAILALGDGVATGLGLGTRGVMRLGLFTVSLVSAMVVTTVGMIPFIGLVVPNIISRIMGDNLRESLPIVALAGAVLLLFCDLVGRLIRYPFEIPVGTVMGFIGAGIFLWLLYRRPARV